MADMTATTLANVQKAVWSDVPSVTYRSNTILAELLDHRWEPELSVGRGDRVNVWGFTQNTGASNRGAGTGTFGTAAAITFTANTESQTQLVVNRFYYMADRMAVESTAQVIPAYVMRLAEGRGQAIALQEDSDIASDNTNGIDAFTTVVGVDNVDITEDNLFEVQTNLNNQNTEVGGPDRYIVASPASIASMSKIESLRNTLYSASTGGLNAGLSRGYIGKALTFSVYMSNNLEAGVAGKKNGAFHREAIAYARQMQLQTESNVQIEDGGFRQNMTFLTCGFKILKSAFGNELDGK